MICTALSIQMISPISKNVLMKIFLGGRKFAHQNITNCFSFMNIRHVPNPIPDIFPPVYLQPCSISYLGPVVSSSALSENKVVWSEDLSERSWSHRVHGTGLQIDQHRSGHIFASYKRKTIHLLIIRDEAQPCGNIEYANVSSMISE